MTFTANIPTISQSLSVSRPLIENNFTNYKNNMEVNHAGVNSATKGKHTLIQMPTVQAASPGTAAGELAFYTKIVSADPQLFMQTQSLAAAGTDIQMTNAFSASITKLGAFASYGTPPVGAVQVGGYSFLPGGLLLQYGFFTTNIAGMGASGDSDVEFPIAFPTGRFTVYPTFTSIGIVTSTGAALAIVPALSTLTTFRVAWQQSGNLSLNGINWWAIGN